MVQLIKTSGRAGASVHPTNKNYHHNSDTIFVFQQQTHIKAISWYEPTSERCNPTTDWLGSKCQRDLSNIHQIYSMDVATGYEGRIEELFFLIWALQKMIKLYSTKQFLSLGAQSYGLMAVVLRLETIITNQSRSPESSMGGARLVHPEAASCIAVRTIIVALSFSTCWLL